MTNGPVVAVYDTVTRLTYVIAAVDQYGCVYSDQAAIGTTPMTDTPKTLDSAKTITASARNISVVVPITVTETN